MTQTTQIHEILQMTPAEYEMDYFERYMRWCMSRSMKGKMTPDDTLPPVNPDDLQKLLANRSVSRWYDLEFAKLEAVFLSMVTNTYKKFEITQLRKFYGTITSEIFTLYPTPLLDAARKLNIINQL